MIITSKEKKSILKWVIYAVLLLVFYVLQTTPFLFVIQGIKPVLLLPLAVCVAMREPPLSSAVFGMFCGLFWDVSSAKLLGFNALLLLLFCMLISLLCRLYVKAKLVNLLWICPVVLLSQALLNYTFYYVIWGQTQNHVILLQNILPTTLYSFVVAPLIFFIVKGISSKLTETT